MGMMKEYWMDFCQSQNESLNEDYIKRNSKKYDIFQIREFILDKDFKGGFDAFKIQEESELVDKFIEENQEDYDKYTMEECDDYRADVAEHYLDLVRGK